MIVEFCGIPGSGKTTISDQVLKTINEKENNRTFYPRNVILGKNQFWGKVIHRLDRHFFRCYQFGKRKKIITLAEKIAKEKNAKNQKYIYRLIELTEAIHRQQHEKNMMLDEGIIQYLTSLSYDKELEMNEQMDELIQIVFPQIQDYYIIDCEISLEESINRLNKRNRKQKHDRYNIDDLQLQKKIMSVKQKNIRHLMNHPYVQKKRVLKIDMTENMDQNIEKICTFLLQGGKR